MIVCPLTLHNNKGEGTFGSAVIGLGVPRFHQLNKSLEVMLRVVWAGCGLGMVLDGDDRERFVAHAFNCSVVEINVRDLNFGHAEASRVKNNV